MKRQLTKFVPGMVTLALALAPAPASLAADTVLLKDGRRFDNVRATLGRDALILETEDGRRLTFTLEELKELRYAPLRPTPAQRTRETERERLRAETAQLRTERELRLQAETRLKESEREAEDLRRELAEARQAEEARRVEEARRAEEVRVAEEAPPASACGYGRPFLEGWIPFWSPHYCSGRYKTGVLFTALETATLYNALFWLPAPRKRSEDGLYQLAGLVTAARVSSGVGDGALVWLYWNQAGETTYYHPRSQRGFIEEADFNKERRFAVLAFLLALFLDGASAHYLDQAAPAPEAAAQARAAFAPSVQVFPLHGAKGLALELNWRF